MNFNKETIDKFISNTFEIDCIDISLTQKTDNDPIVYKGPGTIYQDAHGILRLKLYSRLNDIKKELSHQFKHHPPGKIIAEDNYFALKAVDMSGKEWLADNIWVSANISFPASGQVINSELREIESIEKRPGSEKDCSFMIVPGQFEIPCNEIEDLPNGGRRRNRAVFSAYKLEFEFRKLDNCLIINAKSNPDNLTKDTYLKLIEALSIITGHIVQPVVIKNTLNNTDTLIIKSVAASFANKEFPIPLKHSTPADLGPFSCFLEKYLVNIETPFSDLFCFWHKINRAWQASIENSSLSLGVAIEGTIKTYFSKLGLPDKEIYQQAEEAKQILEKSDLGKRIKDRLLSSIGDLLENTSPKGALYRMAQNGLLNKAMTDAWRCLRNKSVHPDKINQDPIAKQEYINQIYTCIALFYRLLFIIIKYEDSFIDYSDNGWPENKLPLISLDDRMCDAARNLSVKVVE